MTAPIGAISSPWRTVLSTSIPTVSYTHLSSPAGLQTALPAANSGLYRLSLIHIFLIRHSLATPGVDAMQLAILSLDDAWIGILVDRTVLQGEDHSHGIGDVRPGPGR